MNHDDLATRIDAAFDEGPVAPPVDAVLRAGRARLLRRRLAVGGASLAVAAGVTAVAGVAGVGHPDRAEDRSAGSPRPACSVGYDPSDPLVDNWVYLDDSGVPVSVGGAVVTEEIDDPAGRVAPAESAAVAMSCGGFVRWYFLDQAGGGPEDYGYSFSVLPGERAGSSLQDWVDSVLATHQIRDTGPHLVSFVKASGDDPGLRAVAGVTLVAQRPNPDVAEAGGSTVARTAAAQVIWRGSTYFVVAVQAYENGVADYAAFEADEATPTFDAFVAGLPQRYRNGYGG